MQRLELKDFLNYKYISGLEYSPDKKNLGFVSHKSDYDNNCYKSNIYVMNDETKKYFKLTSADEERSFIWLDDTHIMFSAKRDKSLKSKLENGEAWTVFYTIDINGGEADEYMRVPLSVSNIKPIDENTFALTSEYDINGTDINLLEGEEKKKAIEKHKEEKDYEVLDEIPFWSNGSGFTNKKRNRLYIFDKENKKVTPISDEYADVEYFSYKDGKLLYIANRFTDKLSMYNNVYCYDLAAKETTKILDDNSFNVCFADFMADGIVVMASDMKTYGLNQNANFYFHKDNELKLLLEHDTGAYNSVGSDCRYGGGKSFRVYDDCLYFVSTIEKGSFINKLSLDGKLIQLTADNGSIDCFDIKDNETVFVGLRGQSLQEIYSLVDNKEMKLTSFNDDVLKDKYVTKPERFTFENDGVWLEGWVMKPYNYDEAKTYPGILDIHGGPKTVYGEVFYHEMQLWASMGYFVFYTNPRGSDGRGDEFSDIRGKYGTIDYDDLMKFTDLVLEKYPQIDANRLGVTGGSYGGFMTNWIIGHTNRYKCAASQRSISNWISKFGTTDIGYFFNADQIGATPWSDVEKLWFHSPVRYADKCTTPTLFIHSDEDYRCWMAEGLQMFTALKYHGVEARLCLFKGETHELSRSGKPKHRERRLSEITNWFEKHLK